MSTMAPRIETLQPLRFERDRHAPGFPPERLPVDKAFLEQPPAQAVLTSTLRQPRADAEAGPDDARDLAMRMRLLIAREGGVSALARRCGCSEGSVRSWRDGHSDPSRARCVALARGLNVSLPWLIAGEGSMHPQNNEHRDGTFNQPTPSPPTTMIAPVATSGPAGIDAQRLAATLKLLQSYICLVGGSLNVEQRAEIVAELYDLLCDASEPQVVDRLINLHGKLGAQLRSGRTSLI